jgi:hypothetical protein
MPSSTASARLSVHKMLDTTECRRPVQWNTAADSRFGTLVIRHRIQMNSAAANAVYQRVSHYVVTGPLR